MCDKFKTLTVGHGDEPAVSFVPSHVNADVFNRAFEAEGWNEGSETDDSIIHGFYSKKKGKYFFNKEKDDKHTEPCTYIEW